MKLQYHHIRWLVAVVAMMALPAMAEVRDTIDFDINDRTLETITIGNETFNRYSFPDCDHIDRVGAPMLPVKYIRLSVPYNATNITVTGAGNWTSGTASRLIYPAPVPLTTNDPIPEEPELVIDSTIYMTNAFWPAAPAELVGEGFYMGENRIVTVAVYPMLYNPGASRMRNYSQVRVTVSYNLGGTPANMLVRYNSQLRSQEQQQAMEFVTNPKQVEEFAIPAVQVQHAPVIPLPDSLMTDTIGWTYGGMLKSVESYDYMVITTRALKPAFKRLLALKQQKGYSAGAVCVEDILSNVYVVNGDKSLLPDSTYSYINDDAGKIREYLKECYRYGTKYVLFVGNSFCNMPFRYINGKYGTNDFIPSDTYFTDLTSAWSMLNDTVCNYLQTIDPFNPELFVGRILPCAPNELSNYTDKLFRYELNPGNGNTSYLKSALYTQCDWLQDSAYAWISAQQMHPLFPDSIIVEEWNNAYPKGGDVINQINTHHFGYVNFHGHGSPIGLMVNALPISHNMNNWHGNCRPFGVLVDSQYDGYDQSDVDNYLDRLNNKSYPFVFYSIACSAAPFDRFNNHGARYNVGESITLLKDKGGVAYLGNTRNGHPFSFRIESAFQNIILNGQYKLGIADAFSKDIPVLEGNWWQIHDKLAHNLMGDPEISMWTNEPVSYYGITRQNNDNSISISFSEGDTIIVGISDGIRQYMKSSSIGNVTFTNINPNSTVMVYRHNYLPYIAPLYLQNEPIKRSQYVIANDVFAGRNVDNNRTAGDLTIASGSEYEIETKGQVVLAPGFTVEKGALFSVMLSDY